MDWLQLLRMGSIFNPQQMEPTFPSMMGPSSTNPTVGSNNAPDVNGGGMDQIANLLSRLYHPQTTNIDNLNSMISQYPKENEPGFGRKLSAGLVGGLAAAGGNPNPMMFENEILHPGYDKKVKQWQAQIEPTERAANIERQSNSNERILATQTAADVIRQQHLDKADSLKEEAIKEKAKNDEVKANISQQRANAYEFKARNPTMKLFIPKGGNVMAMDNQGQVHDTGIDSGTLSEADKLTLSQENKLDVVKAEGEQKQQLEGIKNKNTLGQISFRGEQSRETKTTPPGINTTPKPELPTQTKVKQASKARQLYNTRADLRPYIHLGPGANDFTVDAPSSNIWGKSGPNPQQYKELQDSIYGTTQPNAPQTPTAPKGWKYVPKPGGGWTAIPDKGSE